MYLFSGSINENLIKYKGMFCIQCKITKRIKLIDKSRE